MSSLSRRVRTALITATAATAVVALAACAGPASSDSSETAEPTDETSATSELPTLTPGTLTIGTGEPAYFPWVIDDDPASGEGFEAAVAYALAEELGFAPENVEWVRTTFDAAIAPGPKDFDINLQQFTITEERKAAVDFSSPYYTTTQAVITTDSSAAAGIDTIDGLKDVVVGVAAGTTSYTVFAEETGTEPQIFNSNADAVLALQANTIDALVVDLPTAFYLTGVELDGGVILGQFAGTEGGDEFGFVLPKGSELTAPVTEALDALRADGTLDALAAEWLSTSVEVPVLK